MNENLQSKNRQTACQIARKYLGGEVSKHSLIDNFPNSINDKELEALYKALTNEPKVGWFFGASKKRKYVTDVYKIIDNLENISNEIQNLDSSIKQRNIYYFQNTCNNCYNNIEIPLLGDFSYGELIFQTLDGKDFLIADLIDNKTFSKIEKITNESRNNQIGSQKILTKLADPFKGKAYSETFPICPICRKELRRYNDNKKTTRHIINYVSWSEFENLSIEKQNKRIEELIYID